MCVEVEGRGGEEKERDRKIKINRDRERGWGDFKISFLYVNTHASQSPFIRFSHNESAQNLHCYPSKLSVATVALPLGLDSLKLETDWGDLFTICACMCDDGSDADS